MKSKKISLSKKLILEKRDIFPLNVWEQGQYIGGATVTYCRCQTVNYSACVTYCPPQTCA
ncbi:class I lanthipeptide [Taibaiella koreensis]|uniref:class I lanthipeptide n=1 Tax=Taibaiella koreensis TaxID=1268548 RepID=UPI001968E5FD